MSQHRLLIDGDEKSWFTRTRNPLWTTSEVAEIDAKRLLRMIPKLGALAVIFRSDDGWHLHFPFSSLTWAEMEAALTESKIEHHGHRAFSMMLKDDTIRVSAKPYKNSHSPTLWKVIKLG